MSELEVHQYFWDGSAPEWVIARVNGGMFPFNLVTGEGVGILDGPPGLMAHILQQMQNAERPILDYVEWNVEQSTVRDVLEQIDRIQKQVWRIRTRAPRELSAQAVEIAAPLKALQTQLQATHQRSTFLQAARQVWAIDHELLLFERTWRL